MRIILEMLALISISVGVGMVIQKAGHRSPEPEMTELPAFRYEFPPIEIRQIAHAMDLGLNVSEEALDMLSAYMEEHPDEWNSWCELEREVQHD
jgi:hypothetical protein